MRPRHFIQFLLPAIAFCVRGVGCLDHSLPFICV